MSDPSASDDDARPDETPTQRADRNWDELLQELRVTQTGVQVLTGFLLTLPFQQRFTQLDAVQKGTYLTAVILGVTAIALLIAPVSSHRLLFHKHKKQVLVETANRFAKAGLVALALTVGAVILLVFDVVLGRGVAMGVAAAVLVVFLVSWFIVPVAVLARDRSHNGA